jgi:anti-sigma regulatory factor (Ser/Thr protein kinase)
VTEPSPSPHGSLKTGPDEHAAGQSAAVLATAPSQTWSRSFPATADQVREARRFLAEILGDWPHAGDALVCLSELASNSVLHSKSRRPGGRFIVRASLNLGMLRVDVEDEGGPWHHRHDQDGQRGRGLAIVGELSSGWSISVGEAGARTAWFEVDAQDAINGCRASEPIAQSVVRSRSGAVTAPQKEHGGKTSACSDQPI